MVGVYRLSICLGGPGSVPVVGNDAPVAVSDGRGMATEISNISASMIAHLAKLIPVGIPDVFEDVTWMQARRDGFLVGGLEGLGYWRVWVLLEVSQWKVVMFQCWCLIVGAWLRRYLSMCFDEYRDGRYA
jgi:hypothetical protein